MNFENKFKDFRENNCLYKLRWPNSSIKKILEQHLVGKLSEMSQAATNYYDIPSVPMTRRPLGEDLNETLGDRWFERNV